MASVVMVVMVMVMFFMVMVVMVMVSVVMRPNGIDTSSYEKALKEQGSADVAYARLMLLGSAGTGKTSLKRSLMEEPVNPHTTSTIVSDVSSVRPFGHKWQTRGNRWREATEEDELEEIARLFKSFNSKSSSHHASVLSAEYSHNESDALVSTSSIASDLNVEICIKLILERASSTDQKTESLVQPFLHIWDCGGQPVFLEILPAFLTPRTMFLLLFDASKDFRERWQSRQNTPDGEVLFGEVVNESTSDLMVKWMSTIHSYLMKPNKDDTSPSLYCIGTRGDKLKGRKKEQIKKQIKSLYKEKEFSDLIKDVLIIDNTTSGKGGREDPSISELRGAIDTFINTLVVPTPVNWVLFRKVFQELGRNIISVSDAIAIGAACHIPARDVPAVLKFYHELGAVLYYSQIKGLKNKVILSPKWFVGIIGKAFPLDKGWSETYRWYLLQNNGILIQPLYEEIWQSSGIDPEEIIELLVHFRLAAPVQTELSRFKHYFLPAVLPGYTGDPNEVRPGYKLRASPVHITFSTGYVPPGFFTRLATAVATNANVKLNFDNIYAAPATPGFLDRLAITMNLRSKVERRSIYRNRVCFSYGRPSDDFVLTDINNAIQVNVLRYVSESRHPFSFKTVCQQILKLLDDCCQQVEETLILYHGHHNDQSSRKIQYVCQCNPSSEVHYIKDIDVENQTCSDPVYCKKERRPRSLTNNESLWFKERTKYLPQGKQLQVETSPRLVDMEEDGNVDDVDDDDDDTTLLIQEDKSTTNYSPTQISESNDDQRKVILTIRNLVEIKQVLKDCHFQAKKWIDLGLYLGLFYSNLKTIETNYSRDAEQCLTECLALWLTEDIEATWEKLAIAVDEVGETSVAGYIRSRKVLVHFV
ncbi:PREDICTED: uncharacterized protein LOC109585579 [Amphimedon queenslandica]|uniref:Death domain-containing protein n=1 Tax=Amphimedon queenslandica TaxID=400682 RepID=A0AAN0JKG9_AMPQE|nr:PREDICTED: uncharacterized protein LOC109585579 [Amphimedon queenslandica]|eukprot:XP_019857262.1 PREDICTED: uncharacterized protein LOC109585579 [Amphimedon queenslandica]